MYITYIIFQIDWNTQCSRLFEFARPLKFNTVRNVFARAIVNAMHWLVNKYGTINHMK